MIDANEIVDDDIEEESEGEKADLDFISELYKKVNKHPYFNYIAITNTLIGRAARASDVKSIWLDNPTKYYFDVIHKNDKRVEGEYSINDRRKEFIYVEKTNDPFEDQVKFAYKLFEQMNLLEKIKQKGQLAVDYINRHGLLSRH